MKPEMAARRIAHGLGYRFRLHRRDLLGTPDIVFPGRKKVIFVHGCFWDMHSCKTAHVPQSNSDYWRQKLERNRARDAKNLVALQAAGCQSLVLWECELNDPNDIPERIRRFLR
jgi:DNA mismatch endonuclease (patch repair protein)